MDGSDKEQPLETPENKVCSQHGQRTVNQLRKKETNWDRARR